MKLFKKIKEFYNNEYEGKISITLSIQQVIFIVISILFLLWIILK